jgi:inhibitor of KinA sporulation pathway (predicted exonuclease)
MLETERSVMTPKYYIIIDFEAVCGDNGWNKSNRMEIIEFAAIFTDKNFKVIKEFDEFIQPVENPILTDYCKNLTTIKQADVDNADTFDKVLSRFVSYMKSISQNKDDFLFCSWGRYDLKQLTSDCELHNVQYPFNHLHCNLKEITAKKVGCGKKHNGMENMLKYLGLTLDGTHHRGIDDCRNILKICRKSQLSLKDMI